MLVAFDLETELIRPGLLAPRIVCSSFAPHGKLVHHSDAGLYADIQSLLTGSDVVAGANIAYDFGCVAVTWPALLPHIFAKYERDEVHDVLIAQTLDSIGRGLLKDEEGRRMLIDPKTGKQLLNPDGKVAHRYSLENVTYLNLNRLDAKRNDIWRLRYGELFDIPLDQWPEEARQYPLDDATNTLQVAEAQRKNCLNQHDLPRQCRAAWALHLASIWGLRANAQAAKDLEAWVNWIHEGAVQHFTREGLVRDDGTEDRQSIARNVARAHGAKASCARCGGGGRSGGKNPRRPTLCADCGGTGLDLRSAPTLPRTPTGGVSVSRDTLEESGVPLLEDYAEFGPNSKLRTTYVPFVLQAAKAPINLNVNVLVSSGRTSYDGLIQLLPRKGGVRECFEARPGYVYCSVDYSAIEMAALAQVCYKVLGWSDLRDAINADKDLHCDLAAAMVNKPYQEVLANKKLAPYSDWRQAAKAGNFGFGGMMGAARFVFSKRKEGLRIGVLMGRETEEQCGRVRITSWKERECPAACRTCVEAAEELRGAWFTKWREMRPYFKWVTQRLEAHNNTMVQLWSGRVRGHCTAPSGANTMFQGLTADGSKEALWMLQKECYLDRKSPLYGSRLVVFAHDETILEIPEENLHEAAKRQCEVMVAGMRKVIPDVKVSAEPAAMRRWYKEAEPVHDSNGRLTVWTPDLKK